MKENHKQNLNSNLSFTKDRIHSDNSGEKNRNLLERVRQSLDRRLQALAVAGFLTFLGPTESYADQVKFSRPADAPAHFTLEAKNTQERLEEFKNKVKTEEPEFFEFTENYKLNIIKEIDDLTARINNFSEDEHRQAQLELRQASVNEKKPDLKSQIKRDRQILEKLKASGDFQQTQEMLKDKLDTILWSFIQLDNSPAVRSEMSKRLSGVKIELKPHSSFGLTNEVAITGVSLAPDQKIQADIEFSLRSFVGEDNNPDMNLYINVFIHELFHGFHAGTSFQGKSMTGLRQIFIEGIAQDATFQTVELLADSNKSIKPKVGMNSYDQRVVLASLINGIIQSSSSPDLLSKWNVEMMTDAEFLSTFKKILPELSLDPAVAEDLGSLNLPNTESYPAITRVLESVIARLQMSGYKLSPEFIKNILISGRNLDDYQVREVEKRLRIHTLDSDVSRRIKKIKNSK